MKQISFLGHLFIVAIITVIFGTIYATVQQAYRSGANDLQLQIVRSLSLDLQKRRAIEEFIEDTIGITQSLSPFVAVYDSGGSPLYSSRYLDKKMPSIPKGGF